MPNSLISAVIEIAPERDGILIFGFKIYFYAILITCGIAIAIIITSRLLKRKGLPSSQSLDYALFVIPAAIIGTRIYFLLFPYSNISYAQFEQSWTWENFWNFRGGGLGIYGGVIMGYITVFIITRVKKQRFYEIGDSVMPGLLIAQSIGRWGNFVNGEAFGNIVTNPGLQFFPYAVNVGGVWHQATFFYESVCTFIGFFIALELLRHPKYRDGLVMCFYGLYYGVVRLIIEGMRTDSLFLRVPIIWERRFWETGIRISQAVSIIMIAMSVIRFIYLYRKELGDLLNKIFKRRKTNLNA